MMIYLLLSQFFHYPVRCCAYLEGCYLTIVKRFFQVFSLKLKHRTSAHLDFAVAHVYLNPILVFSFSQAEQNIFKHQGYSNVFLSLQLQDLSLSQTQEYQWFIMRGRATITIKGGQLFKRLLLKQKTTHDICYIISCKQGLPGCIKHPGCTTFPHSVTYTTSTFIHRAISLHLFSVLFSSSWQIVIMSLL